MIHNRFFWAILTLLTTILGGAWIALSQEPVNQTADTSGLAEAAQAGFLAPDFTATSFLGEEITLSQFHGQPVVLNFWATWCPPCRAEMPAMQATSLKFNGQVAFLAVNQGETVPQIAAFATEYGLTFPLLVDEESLVNRQYRITGLPTTLFIDRQGVVREVFTGTLNGAVLEDRINKLLAEG